MTNIRRFILSAAPLALGICMLAGQASASFLEATGTCGSTTAAGSGTWTCPTWTTLGLTGDTFVGEFVVYNNDYSNGLTSTVTTQTVFTFTGGTMAYSADTLTSTGANNSSPAVSGAGNPNGFFALSVGPPVILAGYDNLVTAGGPSAISVGYNTSTVTGATLADTSYAQIVYEYNVPVTGTPEPATLFLMGSALVGVGMLRKRIKA
jgi:hypothetical protein